MGWTSMSVWTVASLCRAPFPVGCGEAQRYGPDDMLKSSGIDYLFTASCDWGDWLVRVV